MLTAETWTQIHTREKKIISSQYAAEFELDSKSKLVNWPVKKQQSASHAAAKLHSVKC
jgi:hypothetical protein